MFKVQKEKEEEVKIEKEKTVLLERQKTTISREPTFIPVVTGNNSF